MTSASKNRDSSFRTGRGPIEILFLISLREVFLSLQVTQDVVGKDDCHERKQC